MLTFLTWVPSSHYYIVLSIHGSSPSLTSTVILGPLHWPHPSLNWAFILISTTNLWTFVIASCTAVMLMYRQTLSTGRQTYQYLPQNLKIAPAPKGVSQIMTHKLKTLPTVLPQAMLSFYVNIILSLPDGSDVHGLWVPQPLPGGGGRGQGRGVTAVGLAVSRVGRMHVVLVVWSMHVAVVQEQSRVRMRRVHTLHGRVHVIHKLLQVHIIVCGGRGGEGWRKKMSDGNSKSCRKAKIH